MKIINSFRKHWIFTLGFFGSCIGFGLLINWSSIREIAIYFFSALAGASLAGLVIRSGQDNHKESKAQ